VDILTIVATLVGIAASIFTIYAALRGAGRVLTHKEVYIERDESGCLHGMARIIKWVIYFYAGLFVVMGVLQIVAWVDRRNNQLSSDERSNLEVLEVPLGVNCRPEMYAGDAVIRVDSFRPSQRYDVFADYQGELIVRAEVNMNNDETRTFRGNVTYYWDAGRVRTGRFAIARMSEAEFRETFGLIPEATCNIDPR